MHDDELRLLLETSLLYVCRLRLLFGALLLSLSFCVPRIPVSQRCVPETCRPSYVFFFGLLFLPGTHDDGTALFLGLSPNSFCVFLFKNITSSFLFLNEKTFF